MFGNSFRDWLPENAMECIGEQKIEDVPKMVYKNTITGVVFNHDFPLNETFEQSYPIVKAKYERRISRLLNMIRRSRRVLAVHISTPNTAENYSDEYLINVRNYIGECFPGVTIHLLHLHNNNGISSEDAKVKSPAPGVFTSSFCYNAFCHEVPYKVNMKALRKIFSSVRMSGKHISLLESLNRWSAVHPFLNHILRFRISSKGKQVIEIFRIRVCSFNIKNN